MIANGHIRHDLGAVWHTWAVLPMDGQWALIGGVFFVVAYCFYLVAVSLDLEWPALVAYASIALAVAWLFAAFVCWVVFNW